MKQKTRYCKQCEKELKHFGMMRYCNARCKSEWDKENKKPRDTRETNTPSLQSMIKELDLLVGACVKMDAAVWRRVWDYEGWMCRCYTCYKWKPLKEIQAGHGISRQNYKYRYDTRQVKPQCDDCNNKLKGDGMWEAFREHLIQDYGTAYVKQLESDKGKLFQHPYDWYKRQIAMYKPLKKTLTEKIENRLEIA